MSGSLPDTVVVLLVILGAAGTVCVGFATQRLFSKPEPEDNFNQKRPEQVAYMRELRERNMMEAFGDRRPPPHPNGHEI
ncbi:hypothetical protein H2200_008653 [Cladophialophora chaetospira]|uniref:Uncharacterized protein n=1 Tax=Cladophialophora chaetospira TaxID=386627 RepID=A0AA38X4I6_9EURO|nr:hypothetical protein H2200_008653 [Cladophialophora chaetospira]